MRIRQLHVLVELHRIRNLSRTAANLDMTQSALSKWLAELEDDLGVPLFEREPKGIRPTAWSPDGSPARRTHSMNARRGP
ncbi:LysR family transcriptional regulator [Cupriavidus sp. P-10]|uniref:helix-turn-helix domain-containing protein n=1 Tax=unclassified Cupriavidus TaxID=2640874 RepID=UPI000EEC1570|nr:MULTISPECIES: LysR family transcriptional regulator [unclassified Cupriavidus]BDB27392.1 LysR family transcriptional regulator [Cupriavidus sp. P-10]